MKKVAVLLVCLLALGAVFGCSSAGVSQTDYDKVIAENEALKATKAEEVASEAPSQTAEIKPVTTVNSSVVEVVGLMQYSVPSDWRRTPAKTGYYYYPYDETEKGFLYTTYSDHGVSQELTDELDKELLNSFSKGMETGEGVYNYKTKNTTFKGHNAIEFANTKKIGGGNYKVFGYVFVTQDGFYTISYVEPESPQVEPSNSFPMIVDGVQILETASVLDLDVQLENIQFSVPSMWKREDDSSIQTFFYPSDNKSDSILVVTYGYVGETSDFTEEMIESIYDETLKGFEKTEGVTHFEEEKTKISGIDGHKINMNMETDGSNFICEGRVFLYDNYLYIFMASNSDKGTTSLYATYPKIIESIALMGNDGVVAKDENVTQPPAPTVKEDSVETVKETASQKNAVSKAREYLNYTAFSRKKLIEQLEYEGFSNADATYAVDKINADWKEQAIKKAKAYLDYSSFSRQKLIDQLEYEGFTAEQAKYGVDATGL